MCLGLSLIVTSEPPSGVFGFRSLDVPVPRRNCPNIQGAFIGSLNEFTQAVRETFSASHAEVRHDVL